jgi:hypothetical protein
MCVQWCVRMCAFDVCAQRGVLGALASLDTDAPMSVSSTVSSPPSAIEVEQQQATGAAMEGVSVLAWRRVRALLIACGCGVDAAGDFFVEQSTAIAPTLPAATGVIGDHSAARREQLWLLLEALVTTDVIAVVIRRLVGLVQRRACASNVSAVAATHRVEQTATVYATSETVRGSVYVRVIAGDT